VEIWLADVKLRADGVWCSNLCFSTAAFAMGGAPIGRWDQPYTTRYRDWPPRSERRERTHDWLTGGENRAGGKESARGRRRR
jgi:hypothetical protein